MLGIWFGAQIDAVDIEHDSPKAGDGGSHQDVAADGAVPYASAEDAGPRNQGLRPVAADKGFERQIHGPHQRGKECRGSHLDEEVAEQADAAGEVHARQPEGH